MNKKTALMSASDLLSHQDQSEFRLRQKLLMKKYSAEEIDDAIDKLKKHNYLNDERACTNQFELMYESKKYSMKKICFKLKQLGFDDELIECCKPEDYLIQDEEVAIKNLQLKYKSIIDDKKMWTYLMGKGFESSTIKSAIKKFKEMIECQS